MQACGFCLLVAWQRLKRQAYAWRHYVNAAIWGADMPESEVRWGDTAPNLNEPEVPLVRKLSERVQDVVAIRNGGDSQDVTAEFRQFLDECNTLNRKDVFYYPCLPILSSPHQGLDHREAGGEIVRLVVRYKNGMQSFCVVYKDDVVFPPSTRAPGNLIGSGIQAAELVHRETGGGEVVSGNVLDLVKSLAGPCRDFYEGSSYETRVSDVSESSSHLMVVYQDGTRRYYHDVINSHYT
jgi:hypothetical protein